MSGHDAFAPVYDSWAADMVDDVDFYVGLAREAEDPVVEPAVGTARVGIPVAERTGKRVIGIDSSSAMLALARELDHRPRVSLWWATKNEWLGLIEASGLGVEELYGWFDRRPFDDESREFVWIAGKPA